MCFIHKKACKLIDNASSDNLLLDNLLLDNLLFDNLLIDNLLIDNLSPTIIFQNPPHRKNYKQ